MADSVFASIFWDPHPRGIDTGSDFSGGFSPFLHFQALGCSMLPCDFLGLEGTASLGPLRQPSVSAHGKVERSGWCRGQRLFGCLISPVPLAPTYGEGWHIHSLHRSPHMDILGRR